MNKTEATTLVTMLVTFYPGAYFDAGNAAAFEAGIADLDARETHEAIAGLVQTNAKLPVVAELRQEVFRLRKAREAANAEQRRLIAARATAPELGPSAEQWGATLPTMLDGAQRFERMTRRFCEAKGKPYLGDPGEPFVELCKAGASGKDVRGRFRRDVLKGDQDEQERRHP